MTAAWIASVQQSSGAIPWYPGGPLDPWNHIEAAMGLDIGGYHEEAAVAYRWLAQVQNPDGSWYADYQTASTAKDSNFTSYIAVGVLHHSLLCGIDFLAEFWPTVQRAIEFVLRLQDDSGAVRWRDTSEEFLLAGSSSTCLSLLCAHAIAMRLGRSRPDWPVAAIRLRTAIREKPWLFTPKPHAMDWYYPVLCSVFGGQDATDRLAEGWDRFVEPGLGVRCVSDQPWVTGGETAELALTLALRGDSRSQAMLDDVTALLRHPDGSYWTGYQFANEVVWPRERTTWTAGAILLARAAVAEDPAVHTVFSVDFP